MKFIHLVLFIGSCCLLLSCDKSATQVADTITSKKASPRDFYQLKTYFYKTAEQEQVIDTYLQAAFLPALKKQNIQNIGVFKPKTNTEDTTKKTLVLIPFSSIDQFLELEPSLAADPTHLEKGKDYLNASHQNPPYQRINSVFMKAFVDMPKMASSPLSVPRSERVYELRSYESATESYYQKKVDMFNAGGEIKLFDRLNFNAVFYAEVLSGDKMPNLVYMTTFPNMTVRDSLWKEFFASPEWTKLKGMEKYKNSVSHADIDLLYPTSYSDY